MRKVLIITYYWPPAGGISVHRCLKFAKYLPKFGWEPVIYTAENAQYPYFDESNFKDIPKGITILKKPIIEPFNIFKLISGRRKEDSLNSIVQVRDKKINWIDNLGIWIRGNFFIPDARALWIKPSVQFLVQYLKEHPVDAILSDGPPHTNTVIACQVNKKTGIPFLADFQDPWTQADYYHMMKITSWAHRRHSKMEQEVLQYADKITIASPTWKENLIKIGARNVDVIYWGYDEEDFANISQSLDKDFTITHAGLLGVDRLPEKLLKVLGELTSEDYLFKKAFKLQLAGQIDYAIEELINKYRLEDNVVKMGTLPREKILSIISNSQILLLLLNKAENARGRIPGKFFEYLRAKRPILCLGPSGSDVGRILFEKEHGLSLTYDDEASLKRFVSDKFQQFLLKGIPNANGDISQFTVEKQVEKVAHYLNLATQNT